jgi:hypothetical protein
MRVTLVGTVHAECGRAGAVELLAILERQAPDVIFAEMPSANMHQYRDGSHGSLESVVVARYREGRPVAVVPVDLAEPPSTFFRDAQEMFDKVERTSPNYRIMMDRHSLAKRVDGFPPLNSEACVRAESAIHDEILATLDWIRDPRLREIYAVWRRQNELRDSAMVEAIENYARHNAFAHGLFLVGAAHRKSIVDKARVRMGTNSSRIAWELEIVIEGCE